MSEQSQSLLIAIDPIDQSVVIIFQEPITRLALTPQQAEALGNELISRAKQLAAQQNN